MVPKKDQGSGYASERAASQYTSLAMRQGMKAITGQVMSQPGGWEMRQITAIAPIFQHQAGEQEELFFHLSFVNSKSKSFRQVFPLSSEASQAAATVSPFTCAVNR